MRTRTHASLSSPRARRARAIRPLLALALLGACDDPVVPNFNDPTLPAVPNAAELQGQVSGLVSGDREQHAFQILVMETMGRDAYRIDVADPRYLDMPLGSFDPGAFLVDFTWNVRYRTIRSAQFLIQGVDASEAFTDEQKAAARGVARTFQANQYIALIESRDTLGLPISLGIADTLAPIRCQPVVLEYISALLDSAAADLAAAGGAFPFELPGGFDGFNTPATFLQFNRALAAKVLTYRGFEDYRRSSTVDADALNAALALLEPGQSFINLNLSSTDSAALHRGVYHVFSTASGDLQNTNFDNSVHRANPKVLPDLEPGDRRAAKIVEIDTLAKSNAAGTVQSDLLFMIVQGPTAPLPIINNVELILTQAEVLWGLNRDGEALDLVNLVRQVDGGLGPKGAFADRLDLLREILRQKRLSLLWESGARFVDFRMLGLIPELGTEQIRPGEEPEVIPFPQAEIDARGGNLTCAP